MINDCYAFVNKNIDVLAQSSSGGAFAAIASFFLDKLKGVVYGATIDGIEVKHIRVETVDDLPKIMGAKYVQSEIKVAFDLCKQDLLDKRHVLFSGTPCQIYALKKYLTINNIDSSTLVALDFYCHGVPQKKYWNLYLDTFFNNQQIKKIVFRTKKHSSWEKYNFYIKTNKIVRYQRYYKNTFYNGFLKDYILLPSCYECQHKGSDRLSDITIGDFWGVKEFYPEKYNKQGVSVVIFHKELKAIKLFLKDNSKTFFNIPFLSAVYFNPSFFDSAKKPKDFKEYEKAIALKNKKSINKITKNNSSFFNYLRQLIKETAIRFFSRKKIIHIGEKSVGIITDYGYTNYGNRLQNFALRTLVSKYGYEPINIYYSSSSQIVGYRVLSFVKKVFSFLKNYKDFIRESLIKKASLASGEINIPFSYSELGKQQVENFKLIIFGSDQIWNWQYNHHLLPFHLGTFCIDCYKDNIKRISYAASIGTSFIKEEYKPLFKEQLKVFSSIGVRESSASDLLNNLNIKSSLTLDPTLLLSKEQWDNYIELYSKTSIPKHKYNLFYLLKTDFGKEKDAADIDLLNNKTKRYYSNHFDFVKLIKFSNLVITDSFHALVFCIIYQKKVIVKLREGMESRILDLLNLIDVKYEGEKIIDFSIANYKKMEKAIEMSKKYLITSLKKTNN